MAWVKLDVRFFTHPKVIAAGPLACQLYIAGLAYCASHLTDGLIPHGAVRVVAAQAQVNAKLADRLVAVRLWERTAEGYRVHDYLDWNPSRVEAVSEARRRSESARAAAHSRWHPDGAAARNTDARARVPFEDDFDELWQTYPRKVNRKGALAKYVATRRKGADPADLARAVRHYAASVAGKEPEFIMHGATFFGPNERWRDYLTEPAEEQIPDPTRPSTWGWA